MQILLIRHGTWKRSRCETGDTGMHLLEFTEHGRLLRFTNRTEHPE